MNYSKLNYLTLLKMKSILRVLTLISCLVEDFPCAVFSMIYGCFLIFKFVFCVLSFDYVCKSVNQGLATLAFFGVGVNLVLFLTRVLQQNNADAANNVSKWTGTVYIFSLVGAFLSDSYWGRYKTCAIFQIIFVIVSFCFLFVVVVVVDELE